MIRSCANIFFSLSVPMCKDPVLPFSVYVKAPEKHTGLYRTGESVTIACIEGFIPSGSPVIICISGGWTRASFKCERKTLSIQPPISTSFANAGYEGMVIIIRNGVDQ